MRLFPSFPVAERNALRRAKAVREAIPEGVGPVAVTRLGEREWRLSYKIDGGNWISLRFDKLTPSTNYLIIFRDVMISRARYRVAYTVKRSVQFRGVWAAWTPDSPAVGAETYWWAATAGRFVHFRTPGPSSSLGCRYLQSTSGGFGRVFIDGDPTRANLLKTAQQYVDLGLLDSSALVANGGRLAPTDRLLYCYRLIAPVGAQQMFAEDLDPATRHTVKIEATGYLKKFESADRPASNAARVPISRFAWGNDIVEVGDLAPVAADLVKVKQTDAAVTRSGTWTLVNNASAYGGTAHYATATTAYAAYTVPPGDPRDVYLLGPEVLSNAGIFRAEIGGDRSAADGLRPAQQLVDEGTLPSSVLVANGGSLNPTDRVFNQRNDGSLAGNYGQVVLLATNVPGGTEVRVYPTAYKDAASSAFRLYVEGFGTDTGGTIAGSDPARLFAGRTVHDYTGVTEYAYSLTANGETHWVGNGHGGNVAEDAPNATAVGEVSIVLDGVPVDPAVGDELYGVSSVAMDRPSDLVFPALSGSIGTGSLVYTVNAEGLLIEHSEQWTQDLAVQVAYPAMFMAPKTLTSGRASRDSGVLNLAPITGQINIGLSAQFVAWEPIAGGLVAMVEVRNPAVSMNGRESARFSFVNTRADDSKAYFLRRSSVIAPGDFWSSATLYRWNFHPDPDAVLAA